MAAVLLPLAEADLRAPLSDFLSATDASPYGGAGGEAQLSKEVASELLARTDFRGAAVRLDGLEVLGRKFSPQAPFDTSTMTWKVKHSYPWKNSQHINILEAHAFLLWLRRRSRTILNHGQRFLHLFDSAVCVGGFSKGRSSSWRFNRVLRRAGALLTATGQRSHFLWTSSDRMPMDAASRRYQPRSGAGGAR